MHYINKIISVLSLVLINSCKTSYDTKPFSANEVPNTPNYINLDSWAAHPNLENSPLSKFYNTESKVDVFYIYPTIITETSNSDWNADIYNLETRENTINVAIKYQASAWASSANVYSPFYRQVHYRAFFEPYTNNGGIPAYELAYSDIKKAFDFYLDNYNNGKPIIIAGHSQGAGHGMRLLEEYFDEKPLQKKLVAAYLIGANIKEDQFKDIKPMYKADETGGFVNWNSYKKNKKPRINKDPAYNSWKEGNVVVNPITWDKRIKSEIKEHKGLYFYDEKVYPKSLKVEVTKGMLWVSLPKNIPNRLLMRLVRNYHFGDINLFWEDIRLNTKLRINSYFNLLNTK
ncbi:DUF3089 domain-containing protein [Flavobacteriaceae bacterium]|nr:DUF3089 domain-containing protein [Flavobacteriaceae bacterium]MDC1492482.1 DUF3089 domain-containing protein [Flavobacteriaceae bacterium]